MTPSIIILHNSCRGVMVTYFIQGSSDFSMPWCSKQQDLRRVLEQGQNRDQDQNGNEERADGVSNEPAKLLHKDGRDNDTNTAHCVSKHV